MTVKELINELMSVSNLEAQVMFDTSTIDIEDVSDDATLYISGIDEDAGSVVYLEVE